MITFKNLTKSSEKEWNNFVDSCEDGKFEHKYQFINFLSKNKKINESIFIMKNNKIVGIFPLLKENISIFSRYVSNGLLVKNIEKKEIFQKLKKILNSTYIKINSIQKINKDNSQAYTFILDIKKKKLNDILKKDLNKKARYSIRKAEKFKLKINIGYSKKELIKFYPIYVKKMKEYNSTPYTLESISSLLENKEYLIFNVYLKNKVIAGGTMILNNKNITSHLAASDKKYLKYYPNNFLYYSLIKYAIKNNLESISYGPSQLKDKVAKFKISMGGKPNSFEKHIILNKKIYLLYSILYFLILKLKKINKISHNIFSKKQT